VHTWCRLYWGSRPKLQTSRGRSVDRSAHCLTRASSTDWHKWAETMQKSKTDCWPNESLYEVTRCTHLCVGRECWWCSVCCYSNTATGVLRYHLCQHHHFCKPHPLNTLISFPSISTWPVKAKQIPAVNATAELQISFFSHWLFGHFGNSKQRANG